MLPQYQTTPDMIRVFKTTVTSNRIASAVAQDIRRIYPAAKVNFDLEDCDRVLRVEAHDVCDKTILALLLRKGHRCEELA
jgi:hypothetical protein